MLGKAKKTVTLAYKDKLMAEIAHYEKRISDALQKSNSNSLNSFEEAESSDDDSNPYTMNNDPSIRELKTLEASLSNCASLTLELAMLTIMQSEVNVMVTAPEVRTPVKEDGIWLEVAAECKIDLVPFTITFFAHKPHRRFAPVRYRNMEVSLSKAAHQKELAQSVLPKLNRPNLALQVLQGYATGFRSRRTTLLELAQKYADKLNMEAMPEGGYRVKFLDLLTVEWSLENMWSPIVPFCHRMKFEVEYMPKEYIHAIGRLYKHFKDPSLETAERTHVLAEIFDTCLLAQGPARDLQESAESDPEIAGRLHERRTTIDQEPEIPSNYVQMSPKKQPKGKENKAQNRKTAMEPPKTIPKKAKKAAKKTRPDSGVSNDSNVSKKSKPNDKEVTTDNQMDVSKKTRHTGDIQMETSKSRPIEKDDVETRKGIKRVIESDTQTNTKKIRSNNDTSTVSKSSGDKRKNDDVISDTNDVTNVLSKNDAPKMDIKVSSAKNVNNNDDSDKRGDLKSASATNLKKKGVDHHVVSEKSGKNNTKTVDNTKNKDTTGSSGDPKNNKIKPNKEAILHSKSAKENAGNSKKISNQKDKLEPINVVDSVNSKISTQQCEVVKSSKSAKHVVNEVKSYKPTKKTDVGNTNKENAVTKNFQVNITKIVTNVEKNANKNKNVTKKNNIVDKAAVDKVKKVQAESDDVVKNDAKKIDVAKIATTKNIKVKNNNDPNVKSKKDSKKVENKTNNKPNDTVKQTSHKATKIKETLDDAAKKKVDAVPSKAINQLSKENAKTTETNKITNVTLTKINDMKTRENEKMAKPVHSKENAARTTDEKETLVQKNKNSKAVSDSNKKNKDDKTEIAPAATMRKTKIGSEVVNSKDNNIKADSKAKNPTRNEAVEKVTEKGHAKNTAAKVQILSNVKISNAVTTNTKAIISNKHNNATERRVERKFAENQAKITEKLKSQIPTMKSKIKISTLTSKLDKKNAAKAVDAKTKIPQKVLPVFKKTVKNVPTRISPRKLPSSFKPSVQGFSRK